MKSIPFKIIPEKKQLVCIQENRVGNDEVRGYSTC